MSFTFATLTAKGLTRRQLKRCPDLKTRDEQERLGVELGEFRYSFLCYSTPLLFLNAYFETRNHCEYFFRLPFKTEEANFIENAISVEYLTQMHACRDCKVIADCIRSTPLLGNSLYLPRNIRLVGDLKEELFCNWSM